MEKRGRCEGNAVVIVMVLITTLAGMALTMTIALRSTMRRGQSYREETTSMLAAEAGVAEAVLSLRTGGDGNMGSFNAPLAVGGAEFWVATEDRGDGLFAVQATGVERGARSRLELLLLRSGGSGFLWSAFGDEGLSMSSNAFVDSYNSSDDTYDAQVVNGSGMNAWASEEGNVGSNADISMNQNTLVFGDAQPGPTSAATLIGSATVSGSTTPASALVGMPPIVRPTYGSLGNLTVERNVPTTVPSGEREYGTVVLENQSVLEVIGPATLVFQSLELQSGSEFLVDATNGPVEIFVVGDFIMNSNTLMTSLTNSPLDIALNLESDNVIDPDLDIDLDQVDFESNAEFYGTIYAPLASVEINSNFELFGSLVARRVQLDSNCRIHFDEALLGAGVNGEARFETVCWRVLPD